MRSSAEAWVLFEEWSSKFMPKRNALLTIFDDNPCLYSESVEAAA